MNTNNNDEIEIDLREILFVLRRKLLLIVIVTIVAGAAAGLFSYYGITPLYTATSKIYILTNTSSMLDLSDLQVGSSLAADYEELIVSRPVVEKVIENKKLSMTYDELLDCISINNPTNTRIVAIQITYQDPVMAKEIANEFASVSTKQIADIMMVDEPTVVEEAVVPKGKSSPSNGKNAVLGALIGLILTAGIVIVRYLLDDTIKSADDVEKYLGLHTLAAIPEEGGTDNSEKKQSKKSRKKGGRA